MVSIGLHKLQKKTKIQCYLHYNYCDTGTHVQILSFPHHSYIGEYLHKIFNVYIYSQPHSNVFKFYLNTVGRI